METYRTCKLPHPYPDKQTKDLYLCNELNLDLLVELGNRGLWPHLPKCQALFQNKVLSGIPTPESKVRPTNLHYLRTDNPERLHRC